MTYHGYADPDKPQQQPQPPPPHTVCALCGHPRSNGEHMKLAVLTVHSAGNSPSPLFTWVHPHCFYSREEDQARTLTRDMSYP